jgi:YHS domain-containing protein
VADGRPTEENESQREMNQSAMSARETTSAKRISNNINGSEETIVDPVCKMQLGREQIRESLVMDGQSYYFCSVGCRAEFQRHPEDYIRGNPKGGGTPHV